MRKLLIVLTIVLTAGVASAGTASATPQASAFTCSHFTDPTVEFVWSHVCHF